MRPTRAAVLADRGLLRIGGEDRIAFLQGLVSNDVAPAAGDRVVYAAFLTPQGKFLHDLFVAGIGEAVFLDCEAGRREDLLQRLMRHRLRSRIEISDVTGTFAVAVAFDGAERAGGEPGAAKPFAAGVAYADPRLAGAGWRFVLPRAEATADLRAAGFELVEPEAYDRWRLALGLPDGSRDIAVDKDVLLECGFEELNGVDWRKGCYLGQEVTARTKYRGLVKKRLLPVQLTGPAPAPGTPVLLAGRVVGEIRSTSGELAMAMLRLDSLAAVEAGAGDLAAGDARLTPRKPAWMRL
jgi:folate-binding protein YgfZ